MRARSSTLWPVLRTMTVALLVLALSGCIPIGVRVQNMLGSALG